MLPEERISIRVETEVMAPITKVWMIWNDPAYITKWYNASDDWHAPFAENNLKVGDQFKIRMAAKDGSVEFDFIGVYTLIKEHEQIEYRIEDGRKVSVSFNDLGKSTKVIEVFEAENVHPPEVQKGGWQAILDSFKKCVESN